MSGYRTTHLLGCPDGYVCDIDVHVATRPIVIVNDATSAPISAKANIMRSTTTTGEALERIFIMT